MTRREDKNQYKRSRSLCTVGVFLLLLSVVLLLCGRYFEDIVEFAGQARATPALPEPTPTPQSAEQIRWAQWMQADASPLDRAYYIAQLDVPTRELCQGLYQGISAFEQDIVFPEPIDKELLHELMWLIKYDCPELFQISGEYRYYVREDIPDKVLSVHPNYWMTQEEYTLAMAEVEEVLRGWEQQVQGLGLFEAQKLIYDSLMDGCEYLEEGTHTGTVYGALVLGKARCEGYSQALNLALRRVGIPSMIVTGEATTPATEQTEEKTERHAWNVAKLGDGFYHMDPTWDDSKPQQDDDVVFYTYAYFNITDREMYRHRKLDDIFHTTLTLPVCDQMEYNYYVQMDAYISMHDHTQDSFFALLDRALTQEPVPVVMGKMETEAQFLALEENFRDWMNAWYNKRRFKSGSYSWVTYKDSRVFCVTSLEYK